MNGFWGPEGNGGIRRVAYAGACAKRGDAQEKRLALLHQGAELGEKFRVLKNAADASASQECHQIDPAEFLYKYMAQ